MTRSKPRLSFDFDEAARAKRWARRSLAALLIGVPALSMLIEYIVGRPSP